MKKNKLLFVILSILGVFVIGAGVYLMLTTDTQKTSNNEKNGDSKKEKVNRLNEVHTKDGIEISSFTVVKGDNVDGLEGSNEYTYSGIVKNVSGELIKYGKIEIKVLYGDSENEYYLVTVFLKNLDNGESKEFSYSGSMYEMNHYDYEFSVETSEDSSILAY